jgi:DMSO/TMAO reductase YedYZ molybdopterin-dependent catalytic subunit
MLTRRHLLAGAAALTAGVSEAGAQSTYASQPIHILVGYAAGVIGAQFVLAKPQARTIIVAGATVVHRLAIIGLNALIEQHWSGVPWTAILGETVLNGLAALVAFQAMEALSGAVERGRARRRSTFTRRNW